MPNPISVGFGGTGLASMPTPYGVVCAGTTGTGPLQNVVSVGTAGQVLTSNGPAALPTFQPAAGGVPVPYTPPTPWTPVLNFGGSPAGITYSLQLGTYTVIGKVVYFTAYLILTSKGANTGIAQISGLPLPSGGPAAGNVAFSGPFIFTSSASTAFITANFVEPSQATPLIDLCFISTTTTFKFTNTAFTNTSAVQVSGIYFTT